MATSRNWLFAVGGAVVGTAAVIVAIAVVANLNDDGDGSTPVADPSTSQASGPLPNRARATRLRASDTSDAHPHGGGRRRLLRRRRAAGPVLFREFQPGIGGDPSRPQRRWRSPATPLDPDYRTVWPAGTQATASYDGDVITVDLSRCRSARPAAGHEQARRRARPPAGHLQRAGRGAANGRPCSSCSTASTPTWCSASRPPSRWPTAPGWRLLSLMSHHRARRRARPSPGTFEAYGCQQRASRPSCLLGDPRRRRGRRDRLRDGRRSCGHPTSCSPGSHGRRLRARPRRLPLRRHEPTTRPAAPRASAPTWTPGRSWCSRTVLGSSGSPECVGHAPGSGG